MRNTGDHTGSNSLLYSRTRRSCRNGCRTRCLMRCRPIAVLACGEIVLRQSRPAQQFYFGQLVLDRKVDADPVVGERCDESIVLVGVAVDVLLVTREVDPPLARAAANATPPGLSDDEYHRCCRISVGNLVATSCRRERHSRRLPENVKTSVAHPPASLQLACVNVLGECGSAIGVIRGHRCPGKLGMRSDPRSFRSQRRYDHLHAGVHRHVPLILPPRIQREFCR